MATAKSSFEELLSTIRETVDELVDERNETIEDHKKKIEELEEKIPDEDDYDVNQYENTIECGIGTIGWSADNLQLQTIMEEVERLFEQRTPLKLLQLLQAI